MSSVPTRTMAFVVELERFQRRAFRVMFARYLFTACAVAAIAVSAAVLLMRVSSGLELTVIAGAAIAALVGAGVTTFFRRPTLRETAISIDARCQMDDCLAAAVQFGGDVDPVSRLIVEQGHTRLARVTPAEVFPYEWTLHPMGVFAAAAIALLVLVASRSIGISHWSGVPFTAGGSIGMSESTSGTAERSVRPHAHTAVGTATGAATSQFQSTSNTPQESTPSNGQSRLARVDREVQSSPSPGGGMSLPSARANADPANATDVAGASRANRSADSQTAAASASDTTGGSGPANGSVSKEASGQAGGVGAGRTANRAESVQAPQKLPANYGARYREAAGRAEEALAREQVPAELRDTVRAYFTAIRP